MTDVTPNPKARVERLLLRAKEVHDAATRLAADLREEDEGLGHALNATTCLGVVVYKLGEKVER